MLNGWVIVVCAFQVGFGLGHWLSIQWPSRPVGLVRHALYMTRVALVALVALSALWALGTSPILIYPILAAQVLVLGFWYVSLRMARRVSKEAFIRSLPGDQS